MSSADVTQGDEGLCVMLVIDIAEERRQRGEQVLEERIGLFYDR